MIESQSYKRFPAIRCWIKHIIEGNFDSEEKILHTIFGKVKRIRLVASIIDKREIISTQPSDEELSMDEGESVNLVFSLDDGTGNIRANLWKINPENYIEYNKGDIIDLVGLVRQWKEFKSISPEIIKKVENPNLILLRDAEIIKKIISGETQEIHEVKERELSIDEFSEELDVDVLFDEGQSFEPNSEKEKIYSVIEEASINGNGISFDKLKSMIQISIDKLRRYLKDLEMESRIYPSEEDVYQSY